MAIPIGKTNLSAGELAPSLHGRWDLQKYQAGVKTGRNVYVNYKGGMTGRPGSALVGMPKTQSGKARMIRFRFGSAQSYVLALDAGGFMNILLRGGLITETPINIDSAVNANPLSLTVASGTWATNDQIVVEGVAGLVRPNGISGVNGRTLHVGAVAGTTFTCNTQFGNQVFAAGFTAYSGGGTVARILSIPIPWQAADLFDLKFSQSADVLTVTHPSYAPYNIERLSDTSWTVAPVKFGTTLIAPANLTASAVANPGGSSAQFFYPYAVTAVNDDTGEESATNSISVVNGALDQSKGVVNQVAWLSSTGATSYKIYKGQPTPNGTQGAGPFFYGLIGKTTTLLFNDVNFEADFTTVPPTNMNPFQSGPIVSVTMEQAGFGFIDPVCIVFDFTGTGALLTPTVNAAGGVPSTAAVLGGADYSAPRLVFIEGDTTAGTGLTFAFDDSWDVSGSGFVPAANSITIDTAGTHYHVPYVLIHINGAAAGTFRDGIAYCTTSGAVPDALIMLVNPFVNTSHAGITLSYTITDSMPDWGLVPGSDASGLAVLANQNFPSLVSYFDQRKVYAASALNPDTFWTSRPGLFNNFDVSFPTQSDDAITATLVSGEVNQVESLTSMTSGLIALTTGGAWLIAGAGSSATQPAAFTPSSATATTQSFSGSSGLQPLRINTDLVYEAARGGAVRSLNFNFYVNTYTGVDVSLLSNHLFKGNLAQWVYAEQPQYLIWAVRKDGILLSQCYLKEQEIYGWTRHDTRGAYISVESIPEDQEDAVYVVTHRTIDGNNVGSTAGAYFYERFATQDLGGDAAANIPANPEAAWCLDCAVQYPLTFPDDTLQMGAFQYPGQINPATAAIDAPGQGFADGAVVVEIIDDTGSGAVVSCTASGGSIVSFAVTANGTEYTNPTFVAHGGTGAALSARVMNLNEFVPGNAGTLAGIHVGDVLRVRGGKGIVQSFTSLSFMADMTTSVYGLQMNDEVPNSMGFVSSGDWSCTTPVTIIGGLDHLEGATVGILADGNVQPAQRVVDGCITLEQSATWITVGLMFSAQIGGLPMEAGEPTMQGRRKQQPAITLRTMDTRGIMVGATWDTLVEVKERTDETYGAPIALQDGGNFLTQFIGTTAPGAFPPGNRFLVPNGVPIPGQQRVNMDHSAEQLNTLLEEVTSTGDLGIASSTTLSANTIYYSKIQAPGDGTIHLTQMFAISGYTGRAKMAVYADNGSGTSPSGAALAVSNEIVNPPAGIVTFTYGNTVAVASLQVLWLAFQTDTAQGWRPNTAPIADSQGVQLQAYGGFPGANIGATLGLNFHFGEIVLTPLLGRSNVFPTTFRYGLMSLWFEPMSNAGVQFWGGVGIDASSTAIYGMSVTYNTSADPFGPGYGVVDIGISTGAAAGSSVTFRAPDNVNGIASNIVASIDAEGQVAQCMFNGVVLTPLSSTWVSSAPMASGGMLLTTQVAELHYGLDRAEFCIADIYADAPAAFFDLSIEANRRKFISSANVPAALGTDASSVTGSVPIAFYRVLFEGVAQDLTTNHGTGGGDLWNPGHNLIFCAPGQNTPPPDPSTMLLTPVPLGYKDTRIVIDTQWSEKGEWCILQSYPLPITVLAIVPEVEVGDTPTP